MRQLAKISVLLIVINEIIMAAGDGLYFNFWRNNNTYNWENQYNRRLETRKFSANLGLNGYSTLIKKPGKRWQENITASFDGEYLLTKNFHVSPYISHSRAALQERIIYSSDLKISMPYSGIDFLQISPFIGHRWRKSAEPSGERINRGPSYGIEAEIRRLRIKNYPLRLNISYGNYAIDQIPFSEFRAILGSELTRANGDSVLWQLENLDGVKKYFSLSSTGDRVVRQVKVERSGNYMTRATIGKGYSIRLAVGALRSSYYYDDSAPAKSISESDNFSESYNYAIQAEKNWKSKLIAITGYRWRSDKQDFLGNRLDLWSELGEAFLRIGTILTVRDSIGFDCILGVTSFYGLHEQALNERDVQTAITNLRFRHLFNSHFWGELRTGYSLFHQLYMSSINSANNNRNETYLLGARFGWLSNGIVKLYEDFEIHANYISYDYDRLTINTRNRIFRRAAWNTGIELRLSPALIVKPGYLYRYEDYGKLFWIENNWQQATGWDRRYHRIEMKIEYSPVSRILLEPNYVWESKQDFNYIFEPADTGAGTVFRRASGRDLKQTTGIAMTWKFDDRQYLAATYNRRLWSPPERKREIAEFFNIAVRYLF